jgi:hypothetical protein
VTDRFLELAAGRAREDPPSIARLAAEDGLGNQAVNTCITAVLPGSDKFSNGRVHTLSTGDLSGDKAVAPISVVL